MNKLLQRTVMAYRPLYLHGLLLDGQYRLPRADPPPVVGPARRPRRTLLATCFPFAFRPRGKGGRHAEPIPTPATARHR
ncbi:MAG: hypothetical protein ACTHJO_14465 [Rhodanobacter sp.]